MSLGFKPTSSGLLTADKKIATGACWVWGYQLVGDGTNAATLLIYDAITATGTSHFGGRTVGTDDAPFVLSEPIYFATGIYADVAGTGAGYRVYYTPYNHSTTVH